MGILQGWIGFRDLLSFWGIGFLMFMLKESFFFLVPTEQPEPGNVG